MTNPDAPDDSVVLKATADESKSRSSKAVRPGRQQKKLPEVLNRRLSNYAAPVAPNPHYLSRYAVAAAAVGAGMLALAQPAWTDIVYTPVHENSPTFLSIGGEAQFRFSLQSHGSFFGRGFTRSLFVLGNQPGAAVVESFGSVGVLAEGAHIGPAANFISAGRMGGGNSEIFTGGTRVIIGFGNWFQRFPGFGISGGFLGLKFDINGQAHYGWADLTTQFFPDDFRVGLTLNGIGYNTVAGQPLDAGQGITPEPGTLGLLALGSLGLGLWRRKKLQR